MALPSASKMDFADMMCVEWSRGELREGEGGKGEVFFLSSARKKRCAGDYSVQQSRWGIVGETHRSSESMFLRRFVGSGIRCTR